MFAVLIESSPAQRPRAGWSGRVASLAIHVTLIGAALAFTNRVVADSEGIGRKPMPPIWTNQPPATDHPAPPGGSITAPMPSPDFTRIPDVIPPPGTIEMPGAPIVPVTDPGDPGTITVGIPGTAPRIDTPRDVNMVEERPELVSHPELRYPEIMRQAGIEGRVMVETVLDTLGRAEPALTHAVSNAHQLFVDEALRVVLASRYRPARVDGHAVRVRVQVPVNFTTQR